MTLTPRQRRILEMRARSMTNAAIAHAEGVSLAMVKRETEAIFAKTGAGTMEEAIAKELVPMLVEEHVRRPPLTPDVSDDSAHGSSPDSAA